MEDSMKKLLWLITFTFSALTTSFSAYAEYYEIDTGDAHASIDFRIQHLGYSWMSGRFNTFSGDFSYNEQDPSAAKVEVTIDVASIDTNHAIRDKHLRGDKYLNAAKFPQAHFISTSFEQKNDKTGLLTGDFTLHGVTKPLTIEVSFIGHGKDPWLGYRRGFVGTTNFKLVDYGIDASQLGPSSETVYLTLSVEGIRRSINDDAKQTVPW
jgi:polyisoprenoid-binding protein YceI